MCIKQGKLKTNILNLVTSIIFSSVVMMHQLSTFFQETPRGKAFLSCSTMKELCAIFGKEEQFVARQVGQFLLDGNSL